VKRRKVVIVVKKFFNFNIKNNKKIIPTGTDSPTLIKILATYPSSVVSNDKVAY
jgi:hypothetical protein